MEENKTEAMGRYKIQGHSFVISVPKRVREAMRLIKGDYICFTVVGDRVTMRKLLRSFILGRDEADVRELQTPMRREGTHDGD